MNPKIELMNYVHVFSLFSLSARIPQRQYCDNHGS